jgi:hypothetical protein
MGDPGCESNARGTQTEVGSVVGEAIGPIVWGRSPRYAEANGAKVITAVDLPESVLQALVALVDTVQREFGDAEARRLAAEADRAKPLCRWHPGQLQDYCGPCRSEQIAASE